MNIKGCFRIIAYSLLVLILSNTNTGAQQAKFDQPELTGQFNPKNVFDVKNVVNTKTSVSLIVGDGGTGPYKAVLTNDLSLPAHTIYRPQDLSAFGGKNKLPVVIEGNGGCANSSEQLAGFLAEIASHGFIVIAVGPVRDVIFGMSGLDRTDSKSLLDAMDWAIEQNNDPGSPYYHKIDPQNIAVMGQSCGGLQALTVSNDPRVKTTIALNSGIFATTPSLPSNISTDKLQGDSNLKISLPAVQKSDLKNLHAPVIYLVGGKTDIATANAEDDFKQIENTPVFLASYDFSGYARTTETSNTGMNIGIGHYPATYLEPHGGDFGVAAVAWLKWQLKGDQEAAKMFKGKPCGLEKNPKWTVSKKNID
jgi:hypothetical protein